MSIFLITENTFHAGYLAARWRAAFAEHPEFGGIAVREDRPDESVRIARQLMHVDLAGSCEPRPDGWQRIRDLYPGFSDTEQAMIDAYGVPEVGAGTDPDSHYLGTDLNSASAREWLEEQCAGDRKPFFFVFLDCLLAPWWLTVAGGRVVNAHSAVLPHARGMFAVERVAALGDAELFASSAGATAHYVDDGIDTGPVIRSERFLDPFAFRSLWACKAGCFALAFDLLTEVAAGVLRRPGSVPHGTLVDVTRSGPPFRASGFTEDRRARAQAGYLTMQAELRQPAGRLSAVGVDRPTVRVGRWDRGV